MINFNIPAATLPVTIEYEAGL